MVKFEEQGNVAVITLDDGKANALSPALLAELDAALDRAEEGGSAVVICGREGRFSAGFDLTVLLASPDAARDLLTVGANLLMRIYGFGRPVVMACTGHAIAAGVLLLATGDVRIGARGAFKIGLNEVQNGMPVPILAHRLARDRLDPRAFTDSVLCATMYDADTAAAVGWLDRVVEPDMVLAEAIAEAERLAELPAFAYAQTKKSIRRESIDHILATLQADFTQLMGG